MPIASYQAPRSLSYVVVMRIVSPALTRTRQSGREAVSETSQETGPARS